MSNKLYDILKWITLIFIPALITFYGVVGNTVGFEHTDIVLTIATALDTFLGTCLGISNYQYKKNDEK